MKNLLDVSAPAKLNLFLHVTGQRADGYHLLESLFVLIDWADTLHFEKRCDGQLHRHDLGTALPAHDLCLRAAQLLQDRSGSPWGADISIDKRIPSGAGMGGGSSDAATTLLALNRLWGLNWTKSQLQALAVELGADVPFFIGGENAWVTGIGEQLTPIALPAMTYAVVKPQASVETRLIFTSPELNRQEPPLRLEALKCSPLHLSRAELENVLEQTHNTLQPVAEHYCREIAQAVSWLQQRWAHARMTGSGSAVFALFAWDTLKNSLLNSGNAQSCAYNESFTDLPPSFIGRICQGLLSHPLKDWAS